MGSARVLLGPQWRARVLPAVGLVTTGREHLRLPFTPRIPFRPRRAQLAASLPIRRGPRPQRSDAIETRLVLGSPRQPGFQCPIPHCSGRCLVLPNVSRGADPLTAHLLARHHALRTPDTPACGPAGRRACTPGMVHWPTPTFCPPRSPSLASCTWLEPAGCSRPVALDERVPAMAARSRHATRMSMRRTDPRSLEP